MFEAKIEGGPMSLGFNGYARLIAEDEESAIYRYCTDDSNSHGDSSWNTADPDGEFELKKSSLEEPEIHTKVIRKNGKKHTQIKKITHVVDIEKKLKDKDIVLNKAAINDCYSNDRTSGNITHSLLQKIYLYYQENGVLPTEISYNV